MITRDDLITLKERAQRDARDAKSSFDPSEILVLLAELERWMSLASYVGHLHFCYRGGNRDSITTDCTCGLPELLT